MQEAAGACAAQEAKSGSELAAARRTAAEAVRSAEQAHAEIEAMERNFVRLEKKLAVVSRALESAVALVATLLPLGAEP